MGIIDCHVHLFPEEAAADPQGWAAARGEHRWARLVAPRQNGRQVQGWAGVDRMLRDMDATGIERCVLQGWYWETAATCLEHNRLMAGAIHAHPDRLSAAATFHPSMGDKALEELQRVRDDGFTALGELCPEAQGYSHEDPVFCRVLWIAGGWGWPVTLHVSDPAARDYPGRIATPLDRLVGLAARHPDVKFIYAHLGGMLPVFETNSGVADALRNVSYDTAACALIYDGQALAAAAGVAGAGRILFGSDYPILPAGSADPGFGPSVEWVHRAGIEAGALAAIMGTNARRTYEFGGA